jgi:RNA polymerase sigma-70 factor (ECF subfamily)
VHADAPTAAATDWEQIVALYDLLHARRPNAVVALNRAIAVGELRGPTEALAAVEALATDEMAGYQPFHAARADLLARAGRGEDAVAAYDRAIELTTNPPERAFLERGRAAARTRH